MRRFPGGSLCHGRAQVDTGALIVQVRPGKRCARRCRTRPPRLSPSGSPQRAQRRGRPSCPRGWWWWRAPVTPIRWPARRWRASRESWSPPASTFRWCRSPLRVDPRATVETVGRELSPAAAFAIFPRRPRRRRDAHGGDLGVGSPDRPGHRRAAGSVDPRDSDRGAAVLAVRAVELLKASVAELWFRGAPAPPVPSWPSPASLGSASRILLRSPHRSPTRATLAGGSAWSRLAVEAALALVDHVGGFPADVSPVLEDLLGFARASPHV